MFETTEDQPCVESNHAFGLDEQADEFGGTDDPWSEAMGED